MASPADNRRQHVLSGALIAISVVLFALICLRIMNFELRKDEMLYVPPALLLEDHALYRDFFYNHAPVSAWLFHWIFKATGSEYLLLAGRLGMVFSWLVLGLGIAAISYRLTQSALAAFCITLLAMCNELLLSVSGMTATNNLLPLAFAYLGIGLFLVGCKEGKSAHWAIFLVSGLMLTLAVGVKISAVAYLPPMAIAAFLMPSAMPMGRRLTHVVIPMLAGGLIGSLPLLIPLIADPESMIAHVVRYHLGPHRDYWRLASRDEPGAGLTLGAKLQMGRDIWLSGAISAGIVAIISLYFIGRRQSRPHGRSGWFRPDGALLLVLGILVCTIAISLIPTPSFPQYFATPLICLPLLLALLYGRLDMAARSNAMPVLMAASLVVLVIALPRLVQFVPVATHPDKWNVSRVHKVGQELAQLMNEEGLSGKVATLAPIYPLEGGLEVYPELATGPFAFRTAEFTPPDLARQYRMTSPTEIGALFDKDPPAIILVGFDSVLEQPIASYARGHEYRSTPIGLADRYGDLIAYLRPPTSRPEVAQRQNLQSPRPSAP